MTSATQTERDTFLTDPVEFLKYNEVFWQGAGPKDQAEISVVMLNTGGVARIRTGSKFAGFGNAKRTVPQFALKWKDNPTPNYPPGAVGFMAHWSGYAASKAKDARLDNTGPAIMLTPELTGCTVVCAVGDDSARFSHYNLTKEGGKETLDMADMKAVAAATYAGSHSTLSKEEYRSEGKHSERVKVTVLGVRGTDGRWSFWGQFREDKASGQQIRLVRRLHL